MSESDNNEENNLDEKVEVIEGFIADESDDDDDEDEWQTDVEEDWQSDAKRIFRKHTSSVICCEFRLPDCQFVISGGQDDRAFVWDSDNLIVAIESKGHSDTVACVSSSHDGKYLATADMNGLIQVWEFETRKQVWSTETSSEVTWLKWHPQSHVILAGTNTGDVWLWGIPSGNCKIFPNHGSQTDCGKFLPDGLRAIVGYADGTVKFLNLKKSNTAYHFKDGKTHTGSVCSVDCFRDNIVCASGSTNDCTAKLLDSKSNKLIAILHCDKPSADDENGVESLVFHSSQPTLVTGSLRGAIKVWDISTQTEKLSINNEAGIVKLLLHPNSFLIYAAGLNGNIRCWDSRSGKLSLEWRAHTSEILDMTLSVDGSKIVTASDDGTCCIFDTS